MAFDFIINRLQFDHIKLADSLLVIQLNLELVKHQHYVCLCKIFSALRVCRLTYHNAYGCLLNGKPVNVHSSSITADAWVDNVTDCVISQAAELGSRIDICLETEWRSACGPAAEMSSII